MLKKLILPLFVIALTASTSFAKEIKQGTLQLSGASSLGFVSDTINIDGGNEVETTSFDIDTELNYYVVNNFSIGLLFNYNNSDVDNGFDTTNITSTHIGPVIKLNLPLNNNTNLFLKAAAGYSAEEIEDTYDADGVFFGVGAGISIFPTESVSVDIGFGYSHTTGDDSISDLDITRDAFGGKIGLSVYF